MGDVAVLSIINKRVCILSRLEDIIFPFLDPPNRLRRRSTRILVDANSPIA